MSAVSQGPGWWLASDGKWYPPQEQPGYPPPPSAKGPKKRVGCGCLTGFLLVVALIAIIAAIGASGSKSNKTQSAQPPATPAAAAPPAPVPNAAAAAAAQPALPTCQVAVGELAPAFDDQNLSDAQFAKLERRSLSACGPNNDHDIGAGLVDWDQWATYYKIPIGNTDVNSVLGVVCNDVDQAKQTNVCQDAQVIWPVPTPGT